MTSKERKQARFERRRQKRKQKREELISQIGSAEEVFCYNDMFDYGLACCKNVRWKQSVQTFERHIFSRTAVNRRKVLNREKLYKPRELIQFTLRERGKVRPIEAPYIDDRQIQKTFTKKVLLPLYQPQMIYNNGASLQDKGLLFAQKMLDQALHNHIKKYGYNGWVVITDCKKFFPNADQKKILKRHEELKDPHLRYVADIVALSGHSTNGKGVPIGVEPNQIEMISYPSDLDNYMCCQVGIKGFEHYMDDYIFLVPPDRDPKEVFNKFLEKAAACKIEISLEKTKIIPFGKPFKFCKLKRTFYPEQSNKIVKRGCQDSLVRARRKFRMFHSEENKKMSQEDIFCSAQSCLAYFKQYNNNASYIKLHTYFYKLFGCTLKQYFQNIREIKEIKGD